MEEQYTLQAIIDFFSKGDTVLVGLSGGADSMALLHFLKFGCSDLQLQVKACHVNHNLRGKESDGDMEFVKQICSRWEIPLFIKSAAVRQMAEESGMSEEECGRQVRYDFFEETAGKLRQEVSGKVWIATAHTLTDNLETVLFHFVRGTGLKGLCGIPPVRGNIVRPFLKVSRDEIEKYCSFYQLPFVTDSSNFCEEYSRNKIRRQVVPVMKELNQGLEHTIARTIDSLSEEESFLHQLTEEAYCKAEQNGNLKLPCLMNEPKVIQKRVLKLFLEKKGLPVSYQNISILENMMKTGSGKQNLCKDRFVVAENGVLQEFVPQKECVYYEIPLNEGEYISKTGKSYKIQNLEISTSQTFNKIYKNLFAIFLDCGKICGSIIIRQKRDGDRIKLSNKQHTKSLKKLFQEAGIPPEKRRELFVLADEQGVVAVEGFGVAQRVCCDETTKIYIEIVERT